MVRYAVNSVVATIPPGSFGVLVLSSRRPSKSNGLPGSAAQLCEQGFGGLVEEPGLTLVADLHQGDVGEPGGLVLAHRVDDRVEVGSARDGRRGVLGRDELRRTGEPRGGREIGVDGPAAGEPAELVVRTGDGGVPVRIPADRQLSDDPDVARQSGPLPRLMPRVDDVLV